MNVVIVDHGTGRGEFGGEPDDGVVFKGRFAFFNIVNGELVSSGCLVPGYDVVTIQRGSRGNVGSRDDDIVRTIEANDRPGYFFSE
jgi:hypothetical protein